MTRGKLDFSKVIANIEQALTERGWQGGREKGGLKYFDAPADLGISSKYSIAIPADPTRPGVDSLLTQAVNALNSIYDGNFISLYDQIALKSELGSRTVLSARFIDQKTNAGTIPLTGISNFLHSMSRTLYEAAKFRLGEFDPITKSAAERFSRDCLFLQTAKGSFVARVEVPSITLRQPQLLEDAPDPIGSSEVCSSLFSAIEFLNDFILKSDLNYETESAIKQAIKLFDPTLLESLSKLLIGSEVNETEFSMQIGSHNRLTSTGPVTTERSDRLKEYVNFIKDHFYGEDGIDVTGSIVELRSRDPEGNRNHIVVVSEFYGDRTYFSATLSNEQYQLAVEAHRKKNNVRIVGKGMRLKTQVRITEIELLST